MQVENATIVTAPVRDERGRFAPGNPGGFRRGSQNVVTKRVREILAERLEAGEKHPAVILWEISQDENEPSNVRIKAASEILPYLMPKKFAFEVEGPDEGFEVETEQVTQRLRAYFASEKVE